MLNNVNTQVVSKMPLFLSKNANPEVFSSGALAGYTWTPLPEGNCRLTSTRLSTTFIPSCYWRGSSDG